jgi:orotidine-5'-phosphate decarboxylase
MTSELIVALDVPSSSQIPAILRAMPPDVKYFKVGLELYTGEGPACLTPLLDQGLRVFLDLKLHDIPRTVAHAVKSATRLGASMLTVHAHGGRDMLRAAAEAAAEAGSQRPRLVAVTALTSLDQEDLRELGVSRPLKEHVLALGDLAVRSGIDGLVCSVWEAADFRTRLGPTPILVTPGIRLLPEATARQVRAAGTPQDDQKRVATPEAAVRAGANFIVVGRPILEANDPRAAATQILNAMRSADHERP